MKPFFQEINNILSDKDSVNITISKQSDNLIVSIIPKTNVKDDAVKKIVPLVVSGTASDLDEEYIKIISESIATSLKVVSNIKEFEDSNKKAEENSKASKELKEKAKKDVEDNKKKIDALIKKADAFEAEKKNKSAIECLKQALNFASNKKDIEKRICKLETLSGQNSLFEDSHFEEQAIANHSYDETVDSEEIED